MVEVGRADLEASLKVFLKLRKLSRVVVQGIVRFEAGELAIELGGASAVVKVPCSATLSYILALGVKYTGRDLANRGVRKAIEDAERRADVLIHRAAKTLAKLEVTPDDLKRLVYKTVQHKHPNV
jgi:hypothetical protein